jgi:hypothetical protein
MRVNLGRFHILVPHQLLNGPQVSAVLQQMGGETVPQRLNTLLTNSDW